MLLLRKRVQHDRQSKHIMRNQLKTLAPLSLLSSILIAISYWIIGGSRGIILGIVLLTVTNLMSWYQSYKIALAAYRAQQAFN